MNVTALIATTLLPLAVAARPPCPELPSYAEVRWERHYGPDFDVCLALSSDRTLAFTVYRGNTPPLLAVNLTRAQVGTVAGKPARWYEQGIERDYQAEVFLDASLNNSIRVLVPRSPADTFLERVKLVGDMSIEHRDAP